MKLTILGVLLGLTTSISAAAEIKIVGTIDQVLPMSNAIKGTGRPQALKTVKLLKLELSDQMKSKLAAKLTNIWHASFQVQPQVFNKEKAVQLGMNNTPVLDQGPYGTCVTFAVTAAIDAVLSKGDYISQLCSLQLGNFLEKNGTISSGWDGSFAMNVLNEIGLFGIINKENQSQYGCGNLTHYPLEGGPLPETDMSPTDYHQLSESLQDSVGWTPVIDEFTSEEKLTTANIVDRMKTSLNAKDRLAIGVILADVDQGIAGAIGTHHVKNDTWILTPDILKDVTDYLDNNNPQFMFGGHEMVLTGYDDNAVAKDSKGHTYKGLFKLRNSWGKTQGDDGDFYMTYEYFGYLVLEANRIRQKNSV